MPTQIADLVHELWQRAAAAAVVELRGGPTARQVAARTEEAQSLGRQVLTLRDQLQRESLAYGELRARVARYEVIAREALKRADGAEERERDLLRKIGGLRQQIAEMTAIDRLRRDGRLDMRARQRGMNRKKKQRHASERALPSTRSKQRTAVRSRRGGR